MELFLSPFFPELTGFDLFMINCSVIMTVCLIGIGRIAYKVWG